MNLVPLAIRDDSLLSLPSRVSQAALKHPYLAQFHNPDDEPVLTKPITISMDDNKRSVHWSRLFCPSLSRWLGVSDCLCALSYLAP